MAQRELMKFQNRNQKYYNRHAKNRKLNIGDSALLLLPTEHNKLTLSWRGPYKVVDKIGDVNYKVEIAQGKIKTYHINMLKRYYHRQEFETNEVGQQMTNTGQVDQQTRKEHSPQQAAAVSCVLEDCDPRIDDNGVICHDERLDLYNTKQKETYKDVVINFGLNNKQRKEAEQLVEELKDIFSDIPTTTDIVEHKVELT